MPWKGEKDPYRIWLSEIILQQTRVEQGQKYYHAFLDHFPDIHQLAGAPEEKVFKLWEGLGYYTRCRNLISTARYISKEKGGRFPDDYASIRELNGVGPYTASAIASFAFQLPYAVVDGNVSRVLSRVFGISEPVNSANGKKIFDAAASRLLYKKDPARYNQAIMDFGATVCKPVTPLCGQCIFSDHCIAYTKDRVALLPLKQKKSPLKQRWFYYLVITCGKKIAMKERTGRDIWKHLFEFPLLEFPTRAKKEEVLCEAARIFHLRWDTGKSSWTTVQKQQLTHQSINVIFIRIKVDKIPSHLEGLSWVTLPDSGKLACPKMVRQYLDNFSPADF